jgi:AcrR family transcriptional regulator
MTIVILAPMAQTDQTAEKPEIDGRNLRSQRTRAAVAKAYLELTDLGDLRPSAHRIAERAGVSERAVFRHFQDMESLTSVVAKLQLERINRDLPALVAPTRPFDERLSSFLQRWTWVHERTTTLRRASLLSEPFSSEIQRRHAGARRARMRDFALLFREELEAFSAADCEDVVEGVSAAMSWAAWNHMRRYRGLSVGRATAVVERTIRALLASR